MAVGTVNVTDTTLTNGGAKGDATTDDTAAINSAFARAASIGGVVFFPAARYRTNGTLTIPDVGGVNKWLTLQGEGHGVDGSAGGWAGGASTIEYYGSGICLDAWLTPTLAPGIIPRRHLNLRDIAIHDLGGSGVTGVKIGANMGSVWSNVLIRGFDRNVWMTGEFFYSSFTNVQSYRGQWYFGNPDNPGNDPKAQTAVFFACHFSKYGNATLPALQIGGDSWPGQHWVFRNCYWEGNEGPSIHIDNGLGCIHFDTCYWEGNCQNDTVNYDIYWDTRASSDNIMTFENCYSRFAEGASAYDWVKADINTNSHPTIAFTGCTAAPEYGTSIACRAVQLGVNNDRLHLLMAANKVNAHAFGTPRRMGLTSATVASGGGQVDVDATNCRWTEDQTGNGYWRKNIIGA
jgi:hypothetical protein